MNTAVNAAIDTTATPSAPARKAGRPVDPNSKLVRAKALYNSLIVAGADRKAILGALTKELSLTEGSAAVYYHEAKNDANAAKAPAKVEAVTETVIADENQTG